MTLRRTAALAALVLAAPILANCGARAQTAPRPIAIDSTATPLDRQQPSRTRLGPFAYADGLSLRARGAPQFGGVSGIDVASDGRFVAVTDAGDLIRGRLRLDQAGRLRGVDEASLQRLTDEQGRPYQKKKDGDAEDVTLLPDGGFAVSFEQDHRVLVYAPDGRVRRLNLPAGLKMPDNSGLEALAYWTDPATGQAGLIMGLERGDAFSCNPEGGDCRQILERGRDNPKGFRLTGLDALPDGRLVALYRAFSLWNGLRAVVAEVRPGDERPVRPLVRLAGALAVDNMEGIAALPGPAGGVRVYVVSDDNFNMLQRTLLLAFDWTG